MTQVVRFDKVVPDGKALAHWDGRALFAIGPLPGETAEGRVTRKKKDWAEATVERIVETSPRRGEVDGACGAGAGHFLSCSPWQGVDYDYQLELKRGMLEEVFARPGLKLRVGEILRSPRQSGYRNKLEFTLWEEGARGSGRLGLAFHERGSWNRMLMAPRGCALGSAAMNAAALAVVPRLAELGLAGNADTLTVRQSHTHGHVIAVVLLRREVEAEWAAREFGRVLTAEALRAAGAPAELRGVAVVRKLRHDAYETVWSDGDLMLSETLSGVQLTYPWDSFFQVNPPAFEQALERILAAVRPGSRVIDLYGGAGTIGLSVARVAGEVVGVEIVASSVELANRNAEANGLTNYRAIAVPSEKMDAAILNGADTVIVDPPRAGLHQKVVEMLLEAAPRQIVYLSCNPVTQARDLMMLTGAATTVSPNPQIQYKAGEVTGFDFYPGTLHLESLTVLSKN